MTREVEKRYLVGCRQEKCRTLVTQILLDRYVDYDCRCQRSTSLFPAAQVPRVVARRLPNIRDVWCCSVFLTARFFLLLAVTCVAHTGVVTADECVFDLVDGVQYSHGRAGCTSQCNNAGYCCTGDTGGCQRFTCSMGCGIAWYSATEEACIAECQRGDAFRMCGDFPVVGNQDFYTCRHSDYCGCPMQGATPGAGAIFWGESDDCGMSTTGTTPCEAGCAFARDTPLFSFYGRAVTTSEIETLTANQASAVTSLLSALAKIIAHVTAEATDYLTSSELATAISMVQNNAFAFKSDAASIKRAFAAVRAYEANTAVYGPTFARGGIGVSSRNPKGFSSDLDVVLPTTSNTDCTMLKLQQILIDFVYNVPGMVRACNAYTLFDGNGWRSSEFAPGSVNETSVNETFVHSVATNTSSPKAWGHAVSFQRTHRAKKPLGLYLVPGGVAKIVVPDEVVTNGNFVIRVGALFNDFKNFWNSVSESPPTCSLLGASTGERGARAAQAAILAAPTASGG